MELTNQLQNYIPNYYKSAISWINLYKKIEEKEDYKQEIMAKWMYHAFKLAKDGFIYVWQRVLDGLIYLHTHQQMHRPDTKEIIKLTIKAWNTNPSIVQRQIKSQDQELKNIRQENIVMKKQLMITGEMLEELKGQKKVALLDNRQMVEATLKAWNKNPTIVKKTMDEQESLIKWLRGHVKTLEHQLYTREVEKDILQEGEDIQNIISHKYNKKGKKKSK